MGSQQHNGNTPPGDVPGGVKVIPMALISCRSAHGVSASNTNACSSVSPLAVADGSPTMFPALLIDVARLLDIWWRKS